MQKLKNWDNKTWLSSKKYLTNFNKFLKLKVNFNKNSKILDIGCGRANIISALQNEFKFKTKPAGVDIIKSKDIKKNIIFKKFDGISYLKKNKQKYDLILIKQTIHFFSKKKLNILLNLSKKNLNSKGKILIFSLKTRNNKIPCFIKMKKNLHKSLKIDEILFDVIKKNLKKTRETSFSFKVNISKKKYMTMLRARYISCLLSLSKKEVDEGIDEIKSNFPNQIKFTDTLKCLSFRN